MDAFEMIIMGEGTSRVLGIQVKMVSKCMEMHVLLGLQKRLLCQT